MLAIANETQFTAMTRTDKLCRRAPASGAGPGIVVFFDKKKAAAKKKKNASFFFRWIEKGKWNRSSIVTMSTMLMLLMMDGVMGQSCFDPTDNATMYQVRDELAVNNAAFVAANWSASDPDNWVGYSNDNTVVCDGFGRVIFL